MRRRRVSVLLLDKSLASMRRAIGAFNGMDDDGRQSAVLLHLQHAAEMLLKAALSEKKVKVFDSRSGRSIGFERCLALGSEHLSVTADQAGTLHHRRAARRRAALARPDQRGAAVPARPRNHRGAR